MTNFYYMNLEMGNLVTWEEMWEEARELGYEDITDPTSVLYGEWSEHYSLTNYQVV